MPTETSQRESEAERKGGSLADMSSLADSSIPLPAQVLVTTLLPSACRVLSMYHSHLSNMRQWRETLPSQALRMLHACTPERDPEGYRGSNMFVTPNWWWEGLACSPRCISNTKGRETTPDRLNISGDFSPCYIHIKFRSCLRIQQFCAHCKYVDDPKSVAGELFSSHWLQTRGLSWACTSIFYVAFPTFTLISNDSHPGPELTGQASAQGFLYVLLYCLLSFPPVIFII